MPGQALVYDVEADRFEIAETSDLWADSNRDDTHSAAARCWNLLWSGAERVYPDHHSTGLMLSAGWDSRTLLATMGSQPGYEHVVCYTHGDPHCRQVAIAESICRECRCRCKTDPLVPVEN